MVEKICEKSKFYSKSKYCFLLLCYFKIIMEYLFKGLISRTAHSCKHNFKHEITSKSRIIKAFYTLDDTLGYLVSQVSSTCILSKLQVGIFAFNTLMTAKLTRNRSN